MPLPGAGAFTDIDLADCRNIGSGCNPMTALVAALDFLRAELIAGPRRAVEVAAAARCAGLSERTVYRARRDLGVQAERHGFGAAGAWWLRLPGDEMPIGDTPSDLPDPLAGLERAARCECENPLPNGDRSCGRCGRDK